MTEPDADPDFVFLRPGWGPLFTIGEGARALTGFGEDQVAGYNRLKGFAQRQLIHRAHRGEKTTSAALYSLEDLCVAAALGGLLDLGIADRETMAAASVALYAWNLTENPRPVNYPENVSPIGAAAYGAAHDAAWALKVTVFRGDRTGALRRVITVFDLDAEPPLPRDLADDAMPRATAFVHLRPLLKPLLRHLGPVSGH